MEAPPSEQRPQTGAKNQTSADVQEQQVAVVASRRAARATGLADVHCHLLAGLDDGPASWERAISLCRQLVAEGCTRAAATVHQGGTYFDNSRDEILTAFAELETQLLRANVALEVLPSAEWYLDDRWHDDYAVSPERWLTVGDRGVYALVEFAGRAPHHTGALADRLAARGVAPVLAHIDRFPELLFDPVQAAYLIEEGYFVQMNADSIDGRLGGRLQNACRQLLQAGLVHLVGSDAHDPERRPCKLRTAEQLVDRWCGAATAELLFRSNPVRLLDGEPLVHAAPVSPLRRWLRF